MRALQLRRDLVKQLLRVALAERLLELGRDDVALLDTLATTTEDKYRNGFATQVELLQTQNERTRRANLLHTDTSLLHAEQASLNRFLGRTNGSDWPRLILPPPAAALPPVDELARHAAASAPQLDVLRASMRQSESSVALARKQRLPDVSVGLEGRQSADTGEFREGLLTLGVSIPWGNRSRYAADVKREQRKAEAAQLDIDDMQLTLRDEITRFVIQIENAQREAELYRHEIIPRTQQALESARANWLNNRGTLRDVLDGRRLLLEAQATEARALADQQLMIADLSLHCGLSAPDLNYRPASPAKAADQGTIP